ncbi:CHAD domain-containing protein [Kibdelosporangium banguiense]|uniref:CHAD domain-containing protein n=1 Tax=Kibdelosporangium banguiense TaxID=1365924 RepID=A0ABS4TAK8_9PSEU|nr:CYTH and CHAD domain-containing protein [Kibdelosporangium banguiense]MBP2320994.1 CHAD domain-containing protein [Kibdelosporangium banguiense]
MRTQREIERKYEADSDAEIPELPGVVAEPQRETLDAVYYDTADLRLIRSGLTLRRREGGEDEGWHLKVPAGKDTRDEIHIPLNGKTDPPKQFTDLTLGYTRGAKLQPVAQIKTERTRWEIVGEKGKLLAELTDDQVTAAACGSDAVSWREIEVEGDPAVLDRTEKPLRSAGFHRSKAPSKLARVLDTKSTKPERPDRKARAGKAVMAYVTEQVEKIKHYDVLVRQDADDAVHQLRVATRRLRSALRVYAKLIPIGDLSAELQWLGQRLSTARDLEVQHERMRAAISTLPTELVVGPVEARLTRHFAPEQEKARKAVLQTLRSKRYLQLLDRLETLVTAPPTTKKANRRARKELPKHLSRAERKISRRFNAGEIHRARKAAKRVRYGLELAVPVLGKPADKARKRAKTFTKQGGEYQDSVVARPLLRALGMQAHAAGENGFTFGLLHGREEAVAERAQREMRWG